MGIEQVGDGDGNVHAAECLEEGVGGVLSHPSADERVSGVIVVGVEVCGGDRGTMEVDVDAVVGEGIAEAGVRDQFNARWWHGQWAQSDDARDVGLREDRVVGVQW